jgi:hypothetical protein
MTELEKFIVREDNLADQTKEFVLPRFGEELPIKLRAITKQENKVCIAKADKPGKSGKEWDNDAYLTSVVLTGLVNPNPHSKEMIDALNNSVAKYNAKKVEEAKARYEKALKKWESKGSIEEEKPKEEMAQTKPSVNTASEAIATMFLPGEITAIATAILELSGFNTELKEKQQEIKN